MSELLIQTTINAAYAASYMALVAVGLVLIFGVMGVINFAHGELYMAGAYAVVYFYAGLELPFLLAVAIGMVFVGCLGLLMEWSLFRPLRDNPLGGLIASIGFLLILQSLAVLGFGLRMQNVPVVSRESLDIAGAVLTYERFMVIAVTVILLGSLWVFLRKSKFGWALRAVSQDREAAALQGISINQTARYAMFIGAALAGVAGALTAPLVAPTPYMGHAVIVTAFIIIIVGGIGSLEGAVIAAILYGFVHTFVTTLYDGVIANIVGLLLMLGVLIVMPNEFSERKSVPEREARGFTGVRLFATLALAACLIVLPHLLSFSEQELLVFLVINVMIVVSYRLLTLTGEWSLAHVVLMGVGGYASALYTKSFGVPVPLSVLAGAATSGFVAFLLSFPLFRMTGFYFLIGSFAAGEVIRLVWKRFTDPFGGATGIKRIPGFPEADLGFFAFDPYSPLHYYYLVLAVAALSILILHLIERSRYGLIFNAIHWQDRLAQSVGIDTFRYRLLAFVVASFFAGLGGALYGHYLSTVNPNQFDVTQMVFVVIWTIVGGTTRLYGPILGVVVLTILDEIVLRSIGIDTIRPLLYGLVLILTILFLPKGLESLVIRAGEWRGARSARASSA